MTVLVKTEINTEQNKILLKLRAIPRILRNF